jgi:hypothetical protein
MYGRLEQHDKGPSNPIAGNRGNGANRESIRGIELSNDPRRIAVSHRAWIGAFDALRPQGKTEPKASTFVNSKAVSSTGRCGMSNLHPRLTPIDIIHRAERRRPLDSVIDEKRFVDDAMRQYYRAEYLREERRREWIARVIAFVVFGAIVFLGWIVFSNAGQKLFERIF